MKKLALAVLVGIFCLGATGAFAQAKKETAQEKILRLEVENRVLNERVTALTQEIASLQSQLAAAKAQAHKPVLKAPRGPFIKPYYVNIHVQQKCEKFQKCAQWAAETYERFLKTNRIFKITNIKEETYFKEPSRLWGGSGTTVYKMYIYTNLTRDFCEYIRTGKGKNPTMWEDDFVPAVSYRYHYHQ
ncbi:MAG: hypothetical protein J6Y17_02615 [Elusimicrobiaceae bacterium]|nr:hypothetical protein [Elusimicrobiaceae bacterium]